MIVSVCRKFFPMGRRLIFEQPPPLTASNLHSRSQTALAIGGWVKTLTVNLQSMHDKDNAILTSTMECLSMVGKLTIVYEKDSVEEWPGFVRAVCNYHSLKKLRVKEGNLDLTLVPERYEATSPVWHFPDYLIRDILSSPCISLEEFAHLASLPLHPAVFAQVRAQAHFRTLVFRASVQYNLRDMFNSPTPWGCAWTLNKLVIRTCSGTHCSMIAAHVAAGVFGNLKRLSVINSGYEDPQTTQDFISKPTRWQITVLERLDIDHAADWEVAALSTIHVKEVNMTRVFRQAIIEALDRGGWTGLKVLRVRRLGDESVRRFAELKRACEIREIPLETGAEPYGICHCHDE
jgi:hypothetical protein